MKRMIAISLLSLSALSCSSSDISRARMDSSLDSNVVDWDADATLAQVCGSEARGAWFYSKNPGFDSVRKVVVSIDGQQVTLGQCQDLQFEEGGIMRGYIECADRKGNNLSTKPRRMTDPEIAVVKGPIAGSKPVTIKPCASRPMGPM